MLIVVAPSSIAAATTEAVNSTSARVASIGENSTSSTSERACATAARACPSTSSRVDCSWCSMWMSLVEMNVRARQAGNYRPVHLPRDRLYRLEVTWRGDREARLDDVHAQTSELLRDLQL